MDAKVAPYFLFATLDSPTVSQCENNLQYDDIMLFTMQNILTSLVFIVAEESKFNEFHLKINRNIAKFE